ncbi:hypothetical protein ZHAS_00005976 [Anopheles sinensis]|uniref:Uncharacterized protein n=1 Tax=Anopheles sinensis TaxID=74873 RepID=A0A084VKV6_ANOSI|nr:hypothetical protein ZHAS_00005976 [Anopheles sinensis]
MAEFHSMTSARATSQHTAEDLEKKAIGGSGEDVRLTERKSEGGRVWGGGFG